MPSYGATHDEWLLLKHRTKPRAYAVACDERHSDWDFAERTPASYSSYAFSSSDGPMQLRNNMGGMDEDEELPKDVWYPHQQLQQANDADDSGMGSDQASGSEDDSGMEMEMDVDMGMDSNADLSDNAAGPSTSPVQLQQPEPIIALNSPVVNKRKRTSDVYEMNTGGTVYDSQFMIFDNTKRIRVGA